MPLIFISAGDPSGDIHAAHLMSKLKEIVRNVEFIGIGGEKMQAEGLQSIIPIQEISVVGFWEVLKKINIFRKLMSDCKNILSNQKIDLFLPVDYPGFNIKLAKFAKSQNISVAYYIAPQLWAWGKNRARKLSVVDKLFVVFPFEVDFFKQFGINAEFVGHPLLDNPLLKEIPSDFSDRENIIALLPGSRQQEIENHLELFVQSAMLLKKTYPDFQIALARNANTNLDLYNSFLQDNNVLIEENSLELMKKAKIGIVKTGTSNLEAALAGMPFVMVYKTSVFSYILSKQLIDLEYISIVNILKNKVIIPEIIQKDANPQSISKSLIDLLSSQEKIRLIQSVYSEIRNTLGSANASETTAEKIRDNFFK